MDRRTFLKAALAVPAVAAVMGVPVVAELTADTVDSLILKHNIKLVGGYEEYSDVSWVRASMILADGTEYYDTVQMGGNRLRNGSLEGQLQDEAVKSLVRFAKERKNG